MSLKEFAMVRKRDNIQSWTSLDKKGATICAVLGGAAYLELKDRIKQASILPLKDLALCGNAVVSGQATAWIEDQVNLSTFMGEHREAGLEMVDIVPFASYGEGNGYAIAKGDLDFLNWINIFVTKMQNDGTYVTLAKKYGLPTSILVKGWGQR
jgi:ABC-type amino acid transport substrate-binding protein